MRTFNNLRKAREYVGYTVDEVARCLGITAAEMQATESGDRYPNTMELRKLSRLYHRPEGSLMDVDTLLTWQDVAFMGQVMHPDDRKELVAFAEFLRHWRMPK
jgi:transcriptional regulator with XRE-family HTH domain